MGPSFFLVAHGSSSLTRDETGPPALGVQSLSHWTTREVPGDLLLSGIVSRPRFTKSSHLGVTFASVSWCLMLLGFGVCPE